MRWLTSKNKIKELLLYINMIKFFEYVNGKRTFKIAERQLNLNAFMFQAILE